MQTVNICMNYRNQKYFKTKDYSETFKIPRFGKIVFLYVCSPRPRLDTVNKTNAIESRSSLKTKKKVFLESLSICIA